jgi:predicted rRNA methylase YqxC with S4 and FtsJ domains
MVGDDVDIVVADLSFISLSLVLPALGCCLETVCGFSPYGQASI